MGHERFCSHGSMVLALKRRDESQTVSVRNWTLLAAPKCGTGWGCAAVSSSHTEGSLSSFSAIPMEPWLWNRPYPRDRERKTETRLQSITTINVNINMNIHKSLCVAYWYTCSHVITNMDESSSAPVCLPVWCADVALCLLLRRMECVRCIMP